MVKIEAKTSKQTKIAFAPKCLCLHMQRSVYLPSGHLVKNNAAVSFPELLDLNEFVLGTPNTNHKIFSVPQNVTGYFDKLNSDIEAGLYKESVDVKGASAVNDKLEDIVVGMKSELKNEINSKITTIEKITSSMEKINSSRKRKGKKSINGSDAALTTEKNDINTEGAPMGVSLNSVLKSTSINTNPENEMKIQASVEFPLASTNIKISNFPRPFLYHITAVVLHYGHHESGHFITLRKVRKNNRDLWFRISDQDVERIRDIEMDVFRHGAMYAYMLFYERQ